MSLQEILECDLGELLLEIRLWLKDRKTCKEIESGIKVTEIRAYPFYAKRVYGYSEKFDVFYNPGIYHSLDQVLSQICESRRVGQKISEKKEWPFNVDKDDVLKHYGDYSDIHFRMYDGLCLTLIQQFCSNPKTGILSGARLTVIGMYKKLPAYILRILKNYALLHVKSSTSLAYKDDFPYRGECINSDPEMMQQYRIVRNRANVKQG